MVWGLIMAFDKANSSNVIAQAAFDKANQTAQLSFTTVSANGTSLVADANNDTLTITSAVANGVFVSANASTDALDIGLIDSGVTASGYGDSVSVPTFVVDTKGRLTSASNTSIRSGTTTQTGIVQLQDSVISTSTSNAATPSSVKTTYDLATTANTNAVNAGTYANAAFDKANSANVLAQSGYNQANTATTTAGLAYNHANGAFDKANTATTTADAAFAKANSANVIAQAAFDNSNTKFSSSGGTISGDTTVTGNLIINGTTTTVNTSTVSTTDSLLKLANNNTAGDSLDIGFYGTYNATGQKYAGLVRQAGSNFFLFKDLTTDPTANALAVGSLTASNTATLRANITGGTISSLASAIAVADGGTGATTLTAGGILIGSGTSAVTILANTGTAGTYANAAYVPVITTDTYGRVSAVTNTAIAIDTAAITSGTLADARLPATGTAGTYANASHVPVITTDSKGRVTAVTNTAIAITSTSVTGVMNFAQGGANATTYTTGAILTSNGTAFVALANTGTAGTYANATHVPVISTDAYGRVSAVTNTAIAIDTAAITSGTIADARLPTKVSVGTFGNSSTAITLTVDAQGRITAISQSAITFTESDPNALAFAIALG